MPPPKGLLATPNPGSCGGGAGEIGPQTLEEGDVPHTQAWPCSHLDPESSEEQVGSCLPISHCSHFLSKPPAGCRGGGGGRYRAEPDSRGASRRHSAGKSSPGTAKPLPLGAWGG